MGVRGGRVRAYREEKLDKRSERRGLGRGEKKKSRRRRSKIQRKREGEPACLHASNLLMVEEKQTISHYLSKT